MIYDHMENTVLFSQFSYQYVLVVIYWIIRTV